MKLWYIATDFRTSFGFDHIEFMNLVTGGWGPNTPTEVYYSAPPSPGPLTWKLSDATLYKTRLRAETMAIGLVVIYPVLLHRLRIEPVKRSLIREMAQLGRITKQRKRQDRTYAHKG